MCASVAAPTCCPADAGVASVAGVVVAVAASAAAVRVDAHKVQRLFSCCVQRKHTSVETEM